MIILKPEAIEANVCEEIINDFLKNDFKIVKIQEIVCDRDAITRFCNGNYTNIHIKWKIEHLANKKMIAMIVSRDNAMAMARKFIGDTNPAKAEEGTLRKKYSKDSFEKADREERDVYNMIHASDSQEEFEREVKVLKIMRGVD